MFLGISPLNVFPWSHSVVRDNCGDLLPRICPHVPLRIFPHGRTLAGPRVTPFITDRTTFKALRNIISEPFGPLLRPHLLDSPKSSLICKTMAIWHRNDWWDSSHPYFCISRLARPIPYLQQDWRDNKLCHDTLLDTTASHLAVAMIALSLLRNHHYSIKSRASSALLCFSPIEPYKNPIEVEFKGRQHCEFSYLLSLKGFLLT